MGIKDFFKLSEGENITLAKMRDKTIILDAFEIIYRSALATHEPLTNSKGDITSHINTIFQNIVKYKSFNITPIYVFDTVACKMKNGTLIRRQEAKDKAKEQLKKETDVKIKNKLYKRAFSISDKIINDVKFLLTNMNVSYIEAPNGVEAEQYAAFMVKNGKGYAVMSSDADAVLFGAPIVIKREKGGKYTKHTLTNILNKHGISMEQLIKVGVALGCDFAEKSKGIGVKTVIKKLKDDKVKFSNEQLEAIELFKQPVKNHHSDNSKELSKLDLQKGLKSVYEWLVTDLEFNTNRVYKILQKYGYKGELLTKANPIKKAGKDIIDKDMEEVDQDALIQSILNDKLYY